jgi:drug/metabolite transporter (DMT)-like permease
MLILGLIGLLLLGGGNVSLVYAEETIPSGLSSLVFAVAPLYVALIEMALPKGEPLPRRGWLGLLLGFAGLGALLWPSLRAGLSGDRTLLWAIAALLAGALFWSAGSILSRHARLKVNVFVASAWQMVAAGAFNTLLGTALGNWPRFHVNAASVGSLAYLVTGGSLLGYTSFIYLLELVPVLLGIFLLHERPGPAEFAGMAAIIMAVFLLTTAHVRSKGTPRPVEELEQMPVE